MEADILAALDRIETELLLLRAKLEKMEALAARYQHLLPGRGVKFPFGGHR